MIRHSASHLHRRAHVLGCAEINQTSRKLPRASNRERGLEGWAERLRRAASHCDELWCVFDNTAIGEGSGDALALSELLKEAKRGRNR